MASTKSTLLVKLLKHLRANPTSLDDLKRYFRLNKYKSRLLDQIVEILIVARVILIRSKELYLNPNYLNPSQV